MGKSQDTPTPKKRGREENAIAVLAEELDAAVEREPAQKVKALQALCSEIDQADESYQAQRYLAAHNVLEIVANMLGDTNDNVAVKAAELLTAMVSHSNSVKDRLQHVTPFAFAEAPSQAVLNPIQEAAVQVQDLLSNLVDMVLSGVESREESAEEALVALCNLSRAAKVDYVRELIARLNKGDKHALDRLTEVLDGLDIKDDVSIDIDQALASIIQVLQSGSAVNRVSAVRLVGTLCKSRAGAASYMVREGGLPLVLDLLVNGALSSKDAAVVTAWQLVKDDPKLLHPDSEALGVASDRVATALLTVINSGDVDAEDSTDSNATDSSADNGTANGAADAAYICDNIKEAKQLLRALAAQDAAVKAQLKESKQAAAGGRGSCSIM